MNEPADQSFREKLDSISEAIITFGFFGGILVLGYQSYQWLKIGTWPELPLYAGFAFLNIDLSPIANMQWEGVRKIVVWLLELPLSLSVFGVGVAIGYLVKGITIALFDTYKPDTNNL